MNAIAAYADSLCQRTRNLEIWEWQGRVSRVNGLLVESYGPPASVGDLCRIRSRNGIEVPVEVVGFDDGKLLLMALETFKGIEAGCPVLLQSREGMVSVGSGMLGRVIDGLGRPLDDKGPVLAEHPVPLDCDPPAPMSRPLITEVEETGIRAIDSFIALGKGQRLGIFAGSGVGKSTLLGMLIRNRTSGINVIALVGERGRELNEFIHHDLGAAGMERTVVVVSTSDQAAPLRIRAARMAMSIAEHFRDAGEDVVFMMDSLTRLAYAQREIGLASGEPPTTRGYTPSVFTLLPRLLERAGTSPKGNITGLYTVLVDGGDMDEPVADSVRGILDGHLLLDRNLATGGFYPPIDILGSVSRLDRKVCSPEETAITLKARNLLATYRKNEDLVVIGAYRRGTNPELDKAINFHDRIRNYLVQTPEERTSRQETFQTLASMIP